MCIENISSVAKMVRLSLHITENDAHQWQATLFVGLELPKPIYPRNAPTATDSMTQPLYVMNKSLQM